VSKAKITITGSTDRKIKLNNDGTVDLIFKIPMSQQVPKGLKCMGESYYLIHVAPKTWKKVSADYKEDSFFIIQGECKASRTQSGTPIIEVVCFDIAIKETSGSENKVSAKTEKATDPNSVDIQEVKDQTPKEIQKQEPIADPKENSNRLEKPENKKEKYKLEHKNCGEQVIEKTKWYDPEEIIYIPTADVILTDPIHFTTNSLALHGLLKAASITGTLNSPIAVKPIENGKYSLVMGIRVYAIAKMLNIEKVPAVLRDTTHKEFAEKLGIKTYENRGGSNSGD
jgi:ParB-like nuclease domain.